MQSALKGTELVMYSPLSNIAYMSGWEQVDSVLLLADDKTPQQKLVSSSRKCLGCKQNVNRAGAEPPKLSMI